MEYRTALKNEMAFILSLYTFSTWWHAQGYIARTREKRSRDYLAICLLDCEMDESVTSISRENPQYMKYGIHSGGGFERLASYLKVSGE